MRNLILGLFCILLLYFLFVVLFYREPYSWDDAGNAYEMLNDSTLKLTSLANDINYGRTEDSPIKVGGINLRDGPENEKRYLNALLGPNGESLIYRRLNSCCPFSPVSWSYGEGYLDIYEIQYEGNKTPVLLYLNMYEKDTMIFVPKGFLFKTK